MRCFVSYIKMSLFHKTAMERPFVCHMNHVINNRMLLVAEKMKTTGSNRRMMAWRNVILFVVFCLFVLA